MKQDKKLLLNYETGSFTNAEGVEIATNKLYIDIGVAEEAEPIRINLRAGTNFARDRLIAGLNRGLDLPVYVKHDSFRDKNNKLVTYTYLAVDLVLNGTPIVFKLYIDAGRKDGKAVPTTLEKSLVYAALGENSKDGSIEGEDLPFSD